VHVTTGSLTEAIALVKSECECQCACTEADFAVSDFDGDRNASEPATPSSASCLVWGDPHIETFDGSNADFFDEGDVWLVKSSDVSIQARYKATPFTNGLAATNAVAVGGHFLGSHVLKVGPMENGQITLDDMPILTAFPSDFIVPDGRGTVTYNAQGTLVDGAQASLEKHIVHMSLASGVHVEVMRWANHINVRITMPSLGQDGHCGNFNGVASDDSADQIRVRLGSSIPQSDLLFRTITPPTHGANTPRLEDCPAGKLDAGKDACIQQDPDMSEEKLLSCQFDFCFAGEQYAREDAVV
jgi:hypothetical protein